MVGDIGLISELRERRYPAVVKPAESTGRSAAEFTYTLADRTCAPVLVDEPVPGFAAVPVPASGDHSPESGSSGAAGSSTFVTRARGSMASAARIMSPT